MLKLAFQSIFLPFLHHPLNVFLKVLIDFQWSLNSHCLPRFSYTAIFWVILQQGHTKKPKQGDQREKYCLPFYQFKCLISKQYNLGRTSSTVLQVGSAVKKPNHSSWQNAVVCWSHWQCNIQRFLLSLRQYFLPTYLAPEFLRLLYLTQLPAY